MDSNIEITTPAVSTDLVELATVKAELGITDASQDAKLSRLISVAGDFVAGPEGIGRPPWRQVYTEELPGRGGNLLHLARWPIEAVSELRDRGTAVDSSTYSVVGAEDERDAIYRGGCTWPITDTHRRVGMSGTQDKPLRFAVDYTAGWVMPGGAVTPPQMALPSAIEESALLLVIDWFRGGLETPSGIEAESFEGMRIQYRSAIDSTPMTRAVSALLTRWR